MLHSEIYRADTPVCHNTQDAFMKQKFYIWPRVKGETLHLYLSGPFDVGAAASLREVIDSRIDSYRWIHVHTRGVSMYHLNGWRLFLKDGRIQYHRGKNILISRGVEARHCLPDTAVPSVDTLL